MAHGNEIARKWRQNGVSEMKMAAARNGGVMAKWRQHRRKISATNNKRKAMAASQSNKRKQRQRRRNGVMK
jgi:hypothetical protein